MTSDERVMSSVAFLALLLALWAKEPEKKQRIIFHLPKLPDSKRDPAHPVAYVLKGKRKQEASYSAPISVRKNKPFTVEEVKKLPPFHSGLAELAAAKTKKSAEDKALFLALKASAFSEIELPP